MTDSANTPQMSTPEQLEGIVAPGQENILEEFVQEQENAQKNDKILGKFNTPEDLAKAYTELEKRVGQNTEKEPAEPSSYEETDETYTTEAAAELYGKELCRRYRACFLDLYLSLLLLVLKLKPFLKLKYSSLTFIYLRLDFLM